MEEESMSSNGGAQQQVGDLPPSVVAVETEADEDDFNKEDNFDLATVVEVLQSANSVPDDGDRNNGTSGGTFSGALGKCGKPKPCTPPTVTPTTTSSAAIIVAPDQSTLSPAQTKAVNGVEDTGITRSIDKITKEKIAKNDLDHKDELTKALLGAAMDANQEAGNTLAAATAAPDPVPGAYAIGGINPMEDASGNTIAVGVAVDENVVDLEQPAAGGTLSAANGNNENTNKASESQIVALPINQEDESEVPLPEDLPQAEPYQRARHAVLREKKMFVVYMVLLLAGILVLVAVVVLILVKQTSSDRNTDATVSSTAASSTSNNTSVDGSAGLFPSLESQVLQLFPDYTVSAIQEDNMSAQAQALAWLIEDPSLPEYIQNEWRVQQRFALAALYFATNGDRWAMNTHWLDYSVHECSWFATPNFAFEMPGVPSAYDSEYPNPCDQASIPSDPIVTGHSNNDDEKLDQSYKNLWLYMNELQGSLPAELFWLTSLRSMSLFGNTLTSTISSEVGRLKELEALAFSWSGVTGTIPSELGQLARLNFAAIEGNWLTGSIPSELGLLTNLVNFFADSNSLTGTVSADIFAGFGKMTNLLMDFNFLTGTLPITIGYATTMDELMLGWNNFTGPIPSELGNLKAVQRVGLAMCQFDGSIASELGQMDSLLTLELYSNQLSGEIPSELGSMISMTHLLLQENQLSGTVPVELTYNYSSNSSWKSPLVLFNASGNEMLFSYAEDNADFSTSNSTANNTKSGVCWLNSTYMENATQCEEMFYAFLLPLYCQCDCSC